VVVADFPNEGASETKVAVSRKAVQSDSMTAANISPE
jgi:hypothetical protein